MIEGDDGEQVEVYTADEVTAAKTEAATAAAKAKEDEYTPKLTELTGKLTEAEKAAAARAGEFAHFRKLSDEQVAELNEKDRIIYQNSLALKESEDKRIASETAHQTAAVDAVIKSKSNGNADLEAKIKEMWPLIGVEASTPEQIELKAQMVLGAISTTTPNLIASAAGFNGTYIPPGGGDGEGKTFADTEAGKGLADKLGLVLEVPKKK